MRSSMTCLAAALLLASACGGEDDSGPSASGDQRLVTSLSAAERSDLCEWLQDLEDDSISDEQYCTQEASEGSEQSADCEAQRDTCLEEASQAGDEAPDCSKYTLPKSCKATVAQLKKCFGALADSIKEATERATCEDPEAGRVGPLPAACEGLDGTCFAI